MADISDEIINIFTEKLPHLYQNSSIRQHQVQMALDVADFLFNSKKQIMFVEAPVGTGKSLGLLIPTSIYSREKNKRSIYATSTINLQNQINTEDSKTLCKLHLIKRTQILLALGKRNYLCEKLVNKNSNKFSSSELRNLYTFFDTNKYGLLSEFEKDYPKFDRKKLKLLSMDKLEDNNCPCISHSHRRKYLDQNNILTITNHAQLIQSYNNTLNNFNKIIDFDNCVLIIDEAHDLKENYLSSIEKSFNLKNLPQINRLHEYHIYEYKDEYLDILKSLSKLSKDYRGNESSSSTRYKIKDKDLTLLQDLSKLLKKMIITIESHTLFNQNTKLEKLLDNIENITSSIDNLFDTDNKNWFQFDSKKTLSIHSVTTSFNKKFYDMINRLSTKSKVIFMSGTLTTTEKKEMELNTSWGLTEHQYLNKSYPSIFNLATQSIIYVPTALANSRDEAEHLKNIKNILPSFINYYKGGTLVLCTSNSYVADISVYLKQDSKINNTVFSQDDNSISIISEKFKNDIDSILVGSGSFFTGFSIEGKSLNKLALTKLPFPVPDDPYIELLSKGMSKNDKYKKIVSPSMLVKLEQGLGRLIRSKNDSGVIVIFDNRVKPGHISYEFLTKIGYKITNKWKDVTNFVNTSIKNNKNKQIKTTIFNQKLLTIPLIDTLSEEKRNINNSDPKTKSRVPIIYYEEQNIELKTWLKRFVQTHKEDSNYTCTVNYNQKTPRDFYQAAINFCYQKDISISLVAEEFKFQTDEQRNNFLRLSPTVSGPIK